MKGKIKDLGILLKVSPYSDSSLVLQFFCQRLGNIGVLAKGWKKKQDACPFEPNFGYELAIYEPLESGLYLLSEATLLSERKYEEPKRWSVALAGTELISQLVIAEEEAALYYGLLGSYLDYLLELKDEPLPIFWRLLLRVMQLMGLKLELGSCSHCHSRIQLSGYLKRDCRLLCQKCIINSFNPQETISFSFKARDLIALLPEIGLHLQGLKLDQTTVAEVNELFLRYYQVHFQQKLRLKSLSVLQQLYSQ